MLGDVILDVDDNKCCIAHLLVKPYFSIRCFLSSSPRDFINAFHPGQKPMCQRQNRPARDLGFLSNFSRSLQCVQGNSFLFIIMPKS